MTYLFLDPELYARVTYHAAIATYLDALNTNKDALAARATYLAALNTYLVALATNKDALAHGPYCDTYRSARAAALSDATALATYHAARATAKGTP